MVNQLYTIGRNAAADAIETSVGTNPILRLRTGAPPANNEAADTGSVLATINLPTDWLSAASNGLKSLLGTWAGTVSLSGRASHYRIYNSGGSVSTWQGLVSDPWQASRVYAIGDQVHNGGNVYRATVGGTSASSGGPTGTGASIVDGSVTWTFLQTGTDLTLDNATLNSPQPVSVSSWSYTIGGG